MIALYFIRYALLLIFGTGVASYFAGIKYSRLNLLVYIALNVVCAVPQVLLYIFCGEATVFEFYPLIVHIPCVLYFFLIQRTRIITAIASVTSAYLCCQLPAFFEVLLDYFIDNEPLVDIVYIFALILTAYIIIVAVGQVLQDVLTRNSRSMFVFSILPTIYYVFDYSTTIYSSLLPEGNVVIIEFLPFLLCSSYIIFCSVYFKAYEKTTDAERRANIVNLMAQAQIKDTERMRRSEQEIRLIRHDMRHHLQSIATSIENGDIDAAMNIIKGFSSTIEATVVKRYCSNATVNTVLSSFEERCRTARIKFQVSVTLGEISVDEIFLASILSNALENAFNAQSELPEEERFIKLRMRMHEQRILFSVRNPFDKAPIFVDGMPKPSRFGHGYGTQSIKYLTERLGGHCQFGIEDGVFVFRTII